MTTPSTDTHRVVARTTDGRYVTTRSLMLLDWRTAQAVWTKLNEARRAGRLPLVEYLVVRSDADPDPRWQVPGGFISAVQPPSRGGQAELDVVPFLVGRRHGHKDRQNARRSWGLAHGFKGLKGGWIYRTADLEREAAGGRRAKPVGQGWDVIDALYSRNSTTLNHGHRWYWNDLDLIVAEAHAQAAA